MENDTLPVNVASDSDIQADNNDKFSISSQDRLSEMLKETENELASIQPEIDALEEKLARLYELKQTKQKLITLKLSIQSILNNFSLNIPSDSELENLVLKSSSKLNTFVSRPKRDGLSEKQGAPSPIKGTFYPDIAFEKAGAILKQKTSLNYELFRAIVFAGGRAGTHSIRQYLIDHKITLPASGESFESVPLTDISARINYLIRKGLVTPDGRGYFKATVGWEEVLPTLAD